LETRADYIHLVQMPNLYRGIHRVPDPNTATPTELQSIAGLYAGMRLPCFLCFIWLTFDLNDIIFRS
jgi:hypothetical protein